MKKRLISLLLMLVMCISMASPAFAATADTAASKEQPKYSQWVVQDLLFGDTYGIYPLSWYDKGVTGSIKQPQLRVLLSGLKGKLLESGCAEEKRSNDPVIDDTITVKEALEAFYTVLTNYDYTKDLGFNESAKPVDLMKKMGVYTGKNGELGLNERCTVEQAMVIASRIVTVVYDELDAASKGFFWEIKSGENKAYLLGSIHLADNSIYPFSQKLISAFMSSDALVVEANLYSQVDMDEITKIQMYTDGTTLKDHLSEDMYKKVVDAAAKIGLSEETIKYFKPWVMYLLIESSAVAGGADEKVSAAQLGIDMNFLNYAYMYQKPIYEIEGALFQYKMLDSFSEELVNMLLESDIAALDSALNSSDNDNVTSADEIIDQWLEYWHDGDLDAFTKSYSGDEEANAAAEAAMDPNTKKLVDEMNDKMFTQRNKGMAEYIDKLMKKEGSNTYFIVVGAGHYTSEDSTLDVLKDMGYEINLVK